MVEKSDAVKLDHVTGDVKFCNISFKYADNMPLILDKLNLHIRAGETVALIGPSGGGKSTLAKLLLRLYDPVSGEPSELMIFPYAAAKLVIHGLLKTAFSLYLECTSVFSMVTGSILVDNHDIQRIRLDSLRRHVGLVSQDIVSHWQLTF